MKQTLEITSHPQDLKKVRAFVRQFLGELPVDPQECELMVLGIDEACTNIIRHAYGCSDCEAIVLSCEQTRHKIRFRLRDYGRHADPDAFAGRPIEQIAPGGLGLFFIRRAFDHVDYRPRKLGTELVLIKEFRAVALPARSIG